MMRLGDDYIYDCQIMRIYADKAGQRCPVFGGVRRPKSTFGPGAPEQRGILIGCEATLYASAKSRSDLLELQALAVNFFAKDVRHSRAFEYRRHGKEEYVIPFTFMNAFCTRPITNVHAPNQDPYSRRVQVLTLSRQVPHSSRTADLDGRDRLLLHLCTTSSTSSAEHAQVRPCRYVMRQDYFGGQDLTEE